jgi:hypothetical protein
MNAIHPEGPRAVITQLGRHEFRIEVLDGISRWGPDGYGWTRRSRRGAERCARRALARYLALVSRAQSVPVAVIVPNDLNDAGPED